MNRFLAIAALLTLAACSESPTQPVTTLSGPVQGVQGDGVAIYRGIPYAAPPVGELRWRSPQPTEPWKEPFQADTHYPAFWQDNTGGNSIFMAALTEGAGMGGFTQWMLTSFAGLAAPEVSEDCLALNIITPDGADNLPVMFWIHGGGHQFGDGGGPYESPSLAKQGVVLVSINYRLGLYGFLAHPELAAEDPNGSSGNYGTLDMIAALEWVRDNISAFGGNPNNVTIFGESAGGHSVGQLMATPLTEGLFHRAIAQSGTGYYQFQTVDAANEAMSGYDAGREIAKQLGVSGDNEIAALRELSTDVLAPFAMDPVLSETFHPQIDGHVLPAPTAEIFANGKQAAIPLVVGSNADEGSVLYYMGLSPVDGALLEQPTTTEEWDTLLESQFGDRADEINRLYAVDTDRQVIKAAEQLMGDSWFGRHAFYMASDHSAAGHPTYLYFYERHPPAEGQTIGASHALELAHVFGGFIPFWPWDDRDDALVGEMQGYWTRFASTGNPNADGAPDWPLFDEVTVNEMNFGHEVTNARPVARADRYRAMRDQLARRMQSASVNSTAGGE